MVQGQLSRNRPVSRTLFDNEVIRRVLFRGLLLALVLMPPGSYGLTIRSAPSFIKASGGPLSGVLQVSTDKPSRVTVSVDDGVGRWERAFYDYATDHSVPLFGFKPGRTNQISVTVYDRNQDAASTDQPLVFITDPLPVNFPNIRLLQSDPSVEPGYTLFRVGIHGNTYAYVVIIDSSGEVVWYNPTPSTADVRQLANGNLFMPSTNRFVEMDLLGNEANSWAVPTDLLIDPHDGVPTDHGTILYLSDALRTVSGLPTSATDPTAPLNSAPVLYQKVVEISATNAALLNSWSPIDVLDPRRITYLFGRANGGWDTEHSNAVIEDPSDDSLIVSMRDQNAVIKFSRATGQLRWILGPHEGWGPAWQPYLLTPVGSPFEWQYGQHAPILTAQGTLMLYDDGNFRASPFGATVTDSKNYTRAVEYRINEQTMEVSQVWDYGRTNVAERLYTGYEGSADPLPNGNVLIGFSAVSYVNGLPPSSNGPSAVMARIQEVTHEVVPQIVFDVAITLYDKVNADYLDCTIYRCHRIPDLYGHPDTPVADLSVNYYLNAVPFLHFSADDRRTYLIQASTNLVDWEQIGAPSEDPEDLGTFSFEDTPATPGDARYYRVVTQ